MYEYDCGGNITAKRRYGYTTGALGDVKQTITYEYDSIWKDQLKKFNGQTISYDDIGNPTSDGTWTYTWENGRQLAGMSKSGTTVSFKYNASGLRTRKIVNGVMTKYTLHGKNVVHMTRGSDNLHFFYDAHNKPAVVVYNGTAYAYAKNLQGDIIAILNSTGTAVVTYTYDAWGKPISTTGTMKDTLGKLNPFRYRSYVYDEETGLYYLRSRYYQNCWGRFLNCDAILGTVGAIFSSNLWMYCDNNTINGIDQDGFEINLAHPYAMTRCIGIEDAGGGGGGGGSLVIAGAAWLSKVWSKVVSAAGQLTLLLFPTATYVSELVDVEATVAPTPRPNPTPSPSPTPAPTPTPEPAVYFLAYTVGNGTPVPFGTPLTLSQAKYLVINEKIASVIRQEIGGNGKKLPPWGIWTQKQSDARRLADSLGNKGIHYEEDNIYHLPHYHCMVNGSVHIWFAR